MNYIDHYREAQEKDEQIARLKRDLALQHDMAMVMADNLVKVSAENTELRNRLRLSVGDMFDKTGEDGGPGPMVGKFRVDYSEPDLVAWMAPVPGLDDLIANSRPVSKVEESDPKSSPPKSDDLIDWAKMWGGFPTPPTEPEKPVDPRSEVLRRAIASDKPWTP